VARSLWTELGLTRVLEQLGGRGRDDGVALSERAFVLVANRLVAPGSEHGLSRWLENDFVCDPQGRRWVPAWRDDAARKASKAPRVRVEPRQLQQWYRTLDQLLERKPKIEHELYLRLRDLATFQVDVVFYDLTSTYFEGKGPTVLGAHGYSRDCRPRDPQVLVGLVLMDGWPIAHHVFPGNWRDANTVPEVLGDLDERFGLRPHCVIRIVPEKLSIASSELLPALHREQEHETGDGNAGRADRRVSETLLGRRTDGTESNPRRVCGGDGLSPEARDARAASGPDELAPSTAARPTR